MLTMMIPFPLMGVETIFFIARRGERTKRNEKFKKKERHSIQDLLLRRFIIVTCCHLRYLFSLNSHVMTACSCSTQAENP